MILLILIMSTASRFAFFLWVCIIIFIHIYWPLDRPIGFTEIESQLFNAAWRKPISKIPWDTIGLFWFVHVRKDK